MKLILNGFTSNLSLIQAYLKLIQDFDVTDCHAFFYGEPPVLTIPPATNMVLYNFNQVVLAEYQNVNWNEIMPIDQELIFQMSECEIQVLRMMDRISYESLGYEVRKRMYLIHLRYWNHVIETDQIDLFLACGIPHEVCDYIIYCLCQLKNIPTLLFIQSSIDEVIFLAKDWEEPAITIRAEYDRLRQSATDQINLSARFQAHFDRQILKGQDPVPWYMKTLPTTPPLVRDFSNYIKQNPLKVLAKMFNLPKALLRAVQIKRYLQDTKDLFDFYESNTTTPNLEQSYIYVALHYQPEGTTSPMAEAFVDQVLIIQLLASVLPDHIYLYIKEHPFQTLQGRNITFYRDLLAIRQVCLISRQFNSFRLIENCLAVATATGTAGWEGLFRQKPVLMFGKHFYQYAPAVFPIKNQQECKFAIDQICDQSTKPSLDEMRIFLKAMENFAIIGYADMDYYPVVSISDQDNTKNLYKALQQKLIQLDFPQGKRI